ncbi:MAG: ATP-dependent DNA ligase [Candidatus Altiarchaeota archaeon]|nr:ATP-dependent DNA ligase [Candidatus Altiarchaeota archaeon]
MEYQLLAKTYSDLESTASMLAKKDILSIFLKNTPKQILKRISYLVTGQVFPSWSQKELNMAHGLAIQAISRVTGATREEITEVLKKEGDLGSVTAILLESRKQSTLFSEKLSFEKVYTSFEKISNSEGRGSVEKKISILSDLLSNASPIEAKYLVRTVLGQLRIGAGHGTIRDAIAQAFGVSKPLVEKAISVLNDLGEVSELATKGESALVDIKLVPSRPLKVMLYPKAETVGEALEKTGEISQAEYKYDGFRTQIHKLGKKVIIFTRRLEDVTHQFPDVVDAVLTSVKVNEAIYDSETVGVDKHGFIPFQKISQRIRRKYDIKKISKEIPVETHLFDILYLDGKNLIDEPLSTRLKLLEKSFTPSKNLKIVDHMQGNAKELEIFYQEALDKGAEGLMIKSLESSYKPGQRVGFGYKLKPKAESLDLIVVGAEWGEGKRANWLSSYILAARNANTNELQEMGRMATGMTEIQLEELTQELKKLVIKDGKIVKIKPKIVMEVAYQEIQKSTKYASGFALRFPRLIRVRDDRGVDDIDTVSRIKFLYQNQFKRPDNQ